jgi:hypothetical protein
MLALRPYKIPIKPTKKDIMDLLGDFAFLIGSEDVQLQSGEIANLKRWAEEEPEFVTVNERGEFVVVKIFIQYLEKNPETEFDMRTKKTIERLKYHILCRIVTLWIPLFGKNSYEFLISVGNIKEKDVMTLLGELLPPNVDTENINANEFDFQRIRGSYIDGWMHGCMNRPNVIQRGILYGDFKFSNPTELDMFMDNPDGTRSNQEGIIMHLNNGNREITKRKVRVLRFGKFQVMGINRDDYFEKNKRINVIEECFEIAQRLLKCA